MDASLAVKPDYFSLNYEKHHGPHARKRTKNCPSYSAENALRLTAELWPSRTREQWFSLPNPPGQKDVPARNRLGFKQRLEEPRPHYF